jgi:hypothetical protein
MSFLFFIKLCSSILQSLSKEAKGESVFTKRGEEGCSKCLILQEMNP